MHSPKPSPQDLKALRDRLCFWLVMKMPGPHSFSGRLERWRDAVELALLPYAGAWAYRGSMIQEQEDEGATT